MTGKNLALTAGVLAIAGGTMLWHYAKHGPTASAAPAAAAPAAPRPRAPGPAPHVTKVDKAARDALAAAIKKALAARASVPPATATPPARSGSAGPAQMSPRVAYVAYLSEFMMDLMPLLEDCYSDARSGDAKGSGMFGLVFTIDGAPGVGGVISNSSVLDKAQVIAPAMRDCIEQTMYSLEIDPPDHGGTLRGHATIVASPTAPHFTVINVSAQ